MSAFLCSNRLICGIAQTYCEFIVDGNKNEKKIAKILWSANIKSLAVRYPDKWRIISDVLNYIQNAAHTEPRDHILEMKLITRDCLCFEYQACHYEGWQKSEAKKIVDSVYMYASKLILDEIKGFSELPWGR